MFELEVQGDQTYKESSISHSTYPPLPVLYLNLFLFFIKLDVNFSMIAISIMFSATPLNHWTYTRRACRSNT